MGVVQISCLSRHVTTRWRFRAPAIYILLYIKQTMNICISDNVYHIMPNILLRTGETISVNIDIDKICHAATDMPCNKTSKFLQVSITKAFRLN